MAPPSVEAFFEAAELRCSVYTLTNKSTISDDRIKEIVEFAVKHAPSSFNVQSTRAVVLLKKDHEKLWDIGDAMIKRVMPEQAYQALAPRVAGFRAAYGSVSQASMSRSWGANKMCRSVGSRIKLHWMG